MRPTSPHTLSARVIVITLVGSLLLGCSSQAPAESSPTTDQAGLILTARLARPALRGGHTALAVRLLAQALPIDLTMQIEYADGAKQEVVQRVEEAEASLGWRVPASAPVGLARFRLFAERTCQCGSYPPSQGAMAGSFTIVGDRR